MAKRDLRKHNVPSIEATLEAENAWVPHVNEVANYTRSLVCKTRPTATLAYGSAADRVGSRHTFERTARSDHFGGTIRPSRDTLSAMVSLSGCVQSTKDWLRK